MNAILKFSLISPPISPKLGVKQGLDIIANINLEISIAYKVPLTFLAQCLEGMQ